jgi:hypothetical protein
VALFWRFIFFGESEKKKKSIFNDFFAIFKNQKIKLNHT